MNRTMMFLVFVGFVVLSTGCNKASAENEDFPVIELVSPLPCDTLYFGLTFTLKISITTQSGLGNLKMDLHNNFGHHNHGDHEQACAMDPAKTPISPYFNEWIFGLPAGEKSAIFEAPVFLSDSIAFDTGDYHFHIYVTSQEGYQSFKTLDVKIL